MTQITVSLTQAIPEHILCSNRESALCGANCANADQRVIPHDTDPIADASTHLCHPCMREWLRIEDHIHREVTVRCRCDRIIDGRPIRCTTVVGASDARALSHPNADGNQPVCRDCYQWIQQFPENTVKDPYEEAKPWTDEIATNATTDPE